MCMPVHGFSIFSIRLITSQVAMKSVRTSVEGERFLHKDLWRVVERQLDHALGTPRGAFYDDLVAMVFALHALEAYLNFVGERVAPENMEGRT